jgi:hypothetical protein
MNFPLTKGNVITRRPKMVLTVLLFLLCDSEGANLSSICFNLN